MAKGKKTGGRDIAKGQVLNPHGAGAHNPIVKAARSLTAEQVAQMIIMIATHPDDEMDTLKAMKLTFMERFLLDGLIQAKRKGDLETLLKVLERVIGKVKDHVEHSGDQTTRVIIENYTRKDTV
jgi:hypothetical protein